MSLFEPISDFFFFYFVYLFIVCGQPAVPANAKVKTAISVQGGNTEATYECDSGYELFGPTTTKCDPVRGWEKDLPFCGECNTFLLFLVNLSNSMGNEIIFF